MPSIRCIFLEPSEFAEVSLRRYGREGVCPGPWGYHNASRIIGAVPYPHSDFDGRGKVDHPRDDERWPKKCEQCDYVFVESDHWQHNTLRFYRRDDHATMLTTLSGAPVGSMWYADWYEWKGPDGHCLVVKTPGGDWVVDGPSYNNGMESPGPAWTRTGAPPNVTATPSIHIPGKYHGWLRDGALIDC